MNEERSFERFVADNVAGQSQGTPLPDDFYDDMHSFATTNGQRPEWLALIKEPPMRTDSHLAVGSPTARLAAIVLATMLLAAGIIGASFAGAQLLAAEGPIVVDAAGDGHFETIQEAVAVAADGDEILVKPGTYQGGIDVGVDVVIRGEHRDGVIVEAGIGCSVPDNPFAAVDCPGDPPRYRDTWLSARPYAFLLDETQTEISDLTVRLGTASGVIARGGAPFIHDVTVSASSDDGFATIYVHDGSAATISDSDLGAAVVFVEERSPATVERSSFGFIVANTNNSALTGGPSTIRDNTTAGIRFNGEATVEGNTLVVSDEGAGSSDWTGIEIDDGDGWFIRDNHIEGFGTAIYALTADAGVISGNSLVDNGVAMNLGSGSHAVSGNTVRGGQTGISTVGGSGEMLDNDVEGVLNRGIAIGSSASPTLSGNRSCGNGENLWVADDAEPAIDETNEICENEPAE